MITIGFLHTSPSHVTTFAELAMEIAPQTRALHRGDEQLLATARLDGPNLGVVARLERLLLELIDVGRDVIVYICSTLSGLAEHIGRRLPGSVTVVRIDRAMAEAAVAGAVAW